LIRLERSGLIEARPRNAGSRVYALTSRGLASRAVNPGVPNRPTIPSARPATSRSADCRRSFAGTHRDWLPALLVAVVTGYAVLARPGASRLTDLGVYIGAVSGLRQGASLYDFISGNAPFTYPPFAGLVFLPLTWAPTAPLQLAWTLATVAAVLALAALIARRDGPQLALALMLSAPVSSNLKYGQVSIFLAVLIVADLVHGRRWQGALIGLAAAVKLTPLIFIPMLWLGGRRRAAVTAAATFALSGAVAVAVLPGDSWRFWTTEVMHVSRLGYVASVGNQSLNGALLRFGLAAPVRSISVLLIGGIVVILALRRCSRLAHDGDWLSAAVVVGAAGIVFSPVSWTHHQVWLVLAVLLPVRGPRWLHKVWPVVVLAVMVLPVTALALCGNMRLLLAITVAALLPLGSVRTATDREQRPCR
jgi:alpha-1,2-mannosyltransferase